MDAVIIFSYIHGMREKLDLSNVIDITFYISETPRVFVEL